MKPLSSLDRPLTPEEAAEYLQLPRRTVLDLCKGKRPRLTHARLDYRNFRFNQADLDAFLAKRTIMAR
jgi:excisionase family DNA binding protein